MKRSEVLERIRQSAEARDLEFSAVERLNFTAITVGTTLRTLGRHDEIDQLTARTLFEQFSEELGKEWWQR